jgi:hypothetical protein
LHIFYGSCDKLNTAAKKVDKNVRKSKPANTSSTKTTSKDIGSKRPLSRSQSTRNGTKPSDVKSKTLPRCHSVRQKSDVAKPGTKPDSTAQNKSQTLPRPKKTEQGSKSPSRPNNINLAAGPGPRKMGKAALKQQNPGTSMKHGALGMVLPPFDPYIRRMLAA